LQITEEETVHLALPIKQYSVTLPVAQVLSFADEHETEA